MDSVQNSLFVDDDIKSVISDLKFCKVLNWLDFKITVWSYILLQKSKCKEQMFFNDNIKYDNFNSELITWVLWYAFYLQWSQNKILKKL